MMRGNRFAKKNRKIRLLAIVIAFVVILMSVSIKREISFPIFSNLLQSVLFPVEKTLSFVSGGIRSGYLCLYHLYYVYEENNKLREENEELQTNIIKFTEIESENERLHLALDYKQKLMNYDMVFANVIAHAPTDYFNSLIIDKGSVQGIAKDMVVVTHNGLVGNIAEVYLYSSKVQLLMNTDSVVGAIVQRSDLRNKGIVQGLGKDVLKMTNLPRDANIIKGDKIVTSGLGGVFPKGFLIGEVLEVQNDSGLLKSAIISPAVKFSSLEEVFVIRGMKR